MDTLRNYDIIVALYIDGKKTHEFKANMFSFPDDILRYSINRSVFDRIEVTWGDKKLYYNKSTGGFTRD